MRMEELYEKVKKNRNTLAEDIEDYKTYGESYSDADRGFDEGYVSALDWVMKIMEEADK